MRKISTAKLILSLKYIESNPPLRYHLIATKNTLQKGLITIYRQEIMQDIKLFTAQPKANFYNELLLHLDADCMQSAIATGRKGYDKTAMLCAYLVMKCERFSQLTDLVDYLHNNLLIAHYCGFDIAKPLPSYWTFGRFPRELDNDILKQVMQTQVKALVKSGIVDASFIGLDSTPVAASTKQNNPKSFVKNKFSKAIEILNQTNSFLPINPRGTKDPKKLPAGNPICDAGLAMHQDGKFSNNGRTRQKLCCLFKRTSHLHDCPCQHKNFHKERSATGCCKHVAVPDDYRFSYSRDTAQFKKLYALRTECERYNSRFKATGQERVWVCSFAAAANLNFIAHIALPAIALAAVSCKKNGLYRSLKLLKRSA